MTRFEKDAEETLPCLGPGPCWNNPQSLENWGHKETCPAFHRPIVAARFEHWYNQGIDDLTKRMVEEEKLT